MKNLKNKLTILVIFLFILLQGCATHNPALIKHPDSASVIIEGKGKVKIATYDKDNKWITYGWVDVDNFSGWILSKSIIK